jgi:hypothetical protein
MGHANNPFRPFLNAIYGHFFWQEQDVYDVVRVMVRTIHYI